MQRLVLISKSNKTNEPSPYRPNSLLDTMGKVLGRFIYERLLLVTKKRDGLSDNQFGSRSGRSTIDAIKHVVALASDNIA